MISYRIFDHGSIPGAFSVEYEVGQPAAGLPIGTLVPCPDGDGWHIYYGPRLEEVLGRCLDREIGAQILGFYRQAVIRMEWFQVSGRLDVLHERFQEEQ